MSFSPGADNDDCEPITLRRPIRLGDSLFEDAARANARSFPDIEIFYVVAGSDVAKRTLEDCEVGDYSECERDAQSELPLCEQLTFTPERVGAIKQLNTTENKS